MPAARCCIALFLLVIGAPAEAAAGGWSEEVVVPHAAYAIEGAPSAVVHAPSGFDPARPLHLVVFLHGYRGCARVLMGEGELRCKAGVAPERGWNLAREHDAAGTGTLLVLAQLGFMQRSAHPGCFARAGCFRSFLEEVLAALPKERVAGKRLSDVVEITLVAHSAGFRSALSVLEHGGTSERVRSVVLLDALYADEARFLAVLGAHPRMRLWSLHIGAGAPARNSRALAKLGRKRLGAGAVAELSAAPEALAEHAGKRMVVARVQSGHRELPQKHLAAILRALHASE
jgi:pimeloyl-ACP methyl ester carboxylesterase